MAWRAEPAGQAKNLLDVMFGRAKRGDRIDEGGKSGLFVGYDRNRAVIWWGGTVRRSDEYKAVCERFDKRRNWLACYSSGVRGNSVAARRSVTNKPGGKSFQE